MAAERTDSRGGTLKNGRDLLTKTIDVKEEREAWSSRLATGLLSM